MLDSGTATTGETIDTRLDVSDLVRMFEEAEQSTESARREAALDRDYYDGKQLSDEVRAELRKRRQPEIIANKIKPKVDFYIGLEPNQRQAPKALPRTEQHAQDADSATDALRFVIESEDYYQARASCWRDMVREGIGAVEVAIEMKKYRQQTPYGVQMAEEPCITFRHVAWDRFFYDPASARDDFADAGYLGVVKWMDFADAVALYPDQAEHLNDSLNSASVSDTYDDKPKWSFWLDPKRRRVRVCQIWIKRDNAWYFAEYTKSAILKGGPSPFKDESDMTLCGLLASSAYTDRDNNRYGVIRPLRPLQDELNKSRSKILHLLSTAQIVMEEGAVTDIERARTEAARPDGMIIVTPGTKFEFNTRGDIAQGHMGLLQTVGQEIDLMGPNASMLGQEGDVASGRAIIASQQGGMIQMGDLMDKLRYFDKRVYRLVWNAIRQYWTAPKWVRVTDDDANVRFVGINQPGQMPVAEIEVDIIIDESPASMAPALEQ